MLKIHSTQHTIRRLFSHMGYFQVFVHNNQCLLNSTFHNDTRTNNYTFKAPLPLLPTNSLLRELLRENSNTLKLFIREEVVPKSFRAELKEQNTSSNPTTKDALTIAFIKYEFQPGLWWIITSMLSDIFLLGNHATLKCL